jgi:hypothetical protein
MESSLWPQPLGGGSRDPARVTSLSTATHSGGVLVGERIRLTPSGVAMTAIREKVPSIVRNIRL